MANLADKQPENVPGKFYVDKQCIDCDLCRENVPKHFTRQETDGYSFVHCQPTTADEVAACEEALRDCPVEAIGSNGE